MAKKNTTTALFNNISKRNIPTEEITKAISELNTVDEDHSRKIDTMNPKDIVEFVRDKNELIETPVKTKEKKESNTKVTKTELDSYSHVKTNNKLEKLIIASKSNSENLATYAVSLQMVNDDYLLFNEIKNKMKLEKGVLINTKIFVHLCVQAFRDKHRTSLEELGIRVGE